MVEVAKINNGIIKNKNVFQHCSLPHPSLKVCVVVPARNEANTIEDTLDALQNQWLKNGSRLDFTQYEVLLLANNCTDNTYNVASVYASRYPQFNLHVVSVKLPPSKANIGYVRRVLMDEACRRLSINGLPDGIIASTDGDTTVDGYWLGNIIYEIALGCDAVGGRILTNALNHHARLYYLRDISYRLLMTKAAATIDPEKSNPWPCHHQYFGASLAITCSMYHNCGRLPKVPFLEDMALFNSLVQVDAKIRCSPFVKVYTSPRLDGRVEIGFSEQLKKWAINKTNNIPQLVEPAAALIIKFSCKKSLRYCFETFTTTGILELGDIKIIADKLMIDDKWLSAQIERANYFGALWQKTEDAIKRGSFYENYPLILITQAIVDLRRFLRNN